MVLNVDSSLSLPLPLSFFHSVFNTYTNSKKFYFVHDCYLSEFVKLYLIRSFILTIKATNLKSNGNASEKNEMHLMSIGNRMTEFCNFVLLPSIEY